MRKRSQIQIQQLTTGFRYRGTEKLLHRNLQFEIRSGELISILGPNGSGKSTLIKTLLGFQSPLSGEILFDGVSLQKMSIRQLSLQVAVVLTDRIEDIYLKAFDIIATGRYPYLDLAGKLSRYDINIISEAVQLVGIHDLTDKIFVRLSDGEKQKVLIARAIAQDTPFIILDEPVAFIDAPTRLIIMNLLKRLAGLKNKGVLLATHEVESALTFSDKLLMLGKNQLNGFDTPERIQSAGLIGKVFESENVFYNPGTTRFQLKNTNE